MSKFAIENENDRIIAGFASVEMLDLQGDIVPVSELEKAMYKLMDRGGYIFYGHQNKPVGKILRWEIKEHPETGAKGLWIVAKIFDDYEIDDVVWKLVKQGRLTGFSIGGVGKSKTIMWKENGRDKPVNVLHDIQLMEISLVEKPANQLAKIEYFNTFAKSVSEVKAYEKCECGGWFIVYEDGTKVKIADNDEEAIKKIFTEGDILFGVAREVAKIYEPVFWDEVAIELYGKEYTELTDDEKARVRAMVGKMYDTVVSMYTTLMLEGFLAGIDKEDVDVIVEEIKNYIEDEMMKGIHESVAQVFRKIKNGEKLNDFEKEVLRSVLKLSRRFRTAFTKKDMVKAIVDGYTEIMKPFAGFETFDDCVSKMKERGYDEESAKRICGKLQAEYEKKFTEYLKEVDFDELVREYIKANGLCDVVKEMRAELEKIIEKAEDLRPPKEWWDRCVERTGRPALCGWVFYHHLKPKKPKGAEDKPETAEARERKRKWLKERSKSYDEISLSLANAILKNVFVRTKKYGK